jgi:hypothetical protein
MQFDDAKVADLVNKVVARLKQSGVTGAPAAHRYPRSHDDRPIQRKTFSSEAAPASTSEPKKAVAAANPKSEIQNPKSKI